MQFLVAIKWIFFTYYNSTYAEFTWFPSAISLCLSWTENCAMIMPLATRLMLRDQQQSISMYVTKQD